jgi:hypothetical protein
VSIARTMRARSMARKLEGLYLLYYWLLL